MTLASTPFWVIIAFVGFKQVGPPSNEQLIQSLIVAISSGVIATTLFFWATNKVKEDHSKLASVEATQATQVVFVMIGEVFLLSSSLPNFIATIGLIIIVCGMILHSYYTSKTLPITKSTAIKQAK